MATTTLTVTVKGGMPPVTIRVKLFKNNTLQVELSSLKSFSHPFSDLGTGNYAIYIAGMNNPGASTTCSLTTNEISLNPPDNSPVTKSEETYWVVFRFDIN